MKIQERSYAVRCMHCGGKVHAYVDTEDGLTVEFVDHCPACTDLGYPDATGLTMGKRLRMTRLQRHLSTTKVSKQADVSWETVRRIEQDGNATVAVLARLCRVLGVSLDWIATGRPTRTLLLRRQPRPEPQPRQERARDTVDDGGVRTRRLTCVRCGVAFQWVVRQGGQPKYCDGCRTRRRKPESGRREGDPVNLECSMCGKTFTVPARRGQYPKRCPECRGA